MLLNHRQTVRGLQNQPRLVRAPQGEQRFPKQNVRDHPVAPFGTELAQVFHSSVVVTGVHQRLGEVEPGQLIVGKPFPQFHRAGEAIIAHGAENLLPFRRVQSKFYSPGHDRAANVHRLFATIARRYDLLNDLMSAGLHRRWKNHLVRLAGQPTTVLDLCCGTGDLALRFRARVVGVDFTEAMLRVARTRSPAIAWIRGDALRLPFPDAAFDTVTVGYGLRNLADISAGLCEIQRVLRPGGRLLTLDFGKPEAAAWRRIYFWYLRSVVPVLGKLICGDPDTHAYILASLDDYPAQRGIRSRMEATGFVACGFTEFLGGAMAINYGEKPRG